MQNDEQAIRDLIAEWIAASKAGDSERVLSLMADDVVFLLAGHAPMRGTAGFAAAQAAIRDIRIDATSTVEEVRVIGDWAYAWTTLSLVITKPDGASIERSGPTLSIYRRQGDRWVLYRDANMLAAAS
ncbi:MAG: YybH family protein [Burkholderiaceae bacterium]